MEHGGVSSPIEQLCAPIEGNALVVSCIGAYNSDSTSHKAACRPWRRWMEDGVVSSPIEQLYAPIEGNALVVFDEIINFRIFRF